MKPEFPHASESFRKLNPHLFSDGVRAVQTKVAEPDQRQKNKTRTQWTQGEVELLKMICAGNNAYSLDYLAASLHRTRAAVALKISRLGLGDHARKHTPEHAANTSRALTGKKLSEERKSKMRGRPSAFKGRTHSEATKKLIGEKSRAWIEQNGHPRGMLGKHHSEELKQAASNLHKGKIRPREQIEQMLRTKAERGNLINPRIASWKAGWREIGGKRIYARSAWEANYARFLEFQKVHGLIFDWDHEPETFWFDGIRRGTNNYTPDFRVTMLDSSIAYHEVKGWMDNRSRTKLRRMALYHPTVKMILIDRDWFRANNRKMAGLIRDWETRASPKASGYPTKTSSLSTDNAPQGGSKGCS